MSKFWLPYTYETLDIFDDLSKIEFKILRYILKVSSYESKKSVTTSYGELSRSTGKDRANVNRAIQTLEQKKRIHVRRDGQNRVRITPKIELGNMKKGVVKNDYRGVVKTNIKGVVKNDSTTLLEISTREKKSKKEKHRAKKQAIQKQVELFEQEKFHHLQKDVEGYELEEWINKDTWNDYLAMRKKIKKPATDEAKKRIITKLVKLCNGDLTKHVDILNESIMNSWSGVFDLKDFSHRKTYGDIEEEKRNNAVRQFHRTMSKANGMV